MGTLIDNGVNTGAPSAGFDPEAVRAALALELAPLPGICLKELSASGVYEKGNVAE